MLTIYGKADKRSGFCDGVRRRDFLKIGGLMMGGLSLPQLMQSEAQAGSSRSHKAIIMIFLPGGPPHQDMWDIKSEAPREIRGEFEAIRTNVPGIEICEQFPRIAGMMDKFVPIRTMVGADGGHDSFQCMTGRKKRQQPAGGWPSLGAAVSKLHGPVNESIPPNLTMCYNTGHAEWGDPGQAGFLGISHSPFRLVGGKNGGSSIDNMKLRDMSLERLQDRGKLLASFDSFRREADASGLMEGMDTFGNQAMGILTSSKLVDALDITKEDAKTIARYGKGDPVFRADGAPKVSENFLVARRLVEAGARVVSLNFSRWDWHGGNFKRGREDFPMLDNGVASLVEDLHDRGLDKDVSVVVWGEFGRTPKINAKAGRDHWPRVSCALLAGGGMRTGQVIGATNRLGEYAEDRPVTFPEVFATLYHNMGINTATTTVRDFNGRPMYLVEPGAVPMPELV
ncbi:MAG: hypothetical protein COA78_09555 [Blastopirellula sp.]|nr:MAG: hypothetical protein COA78_09555 [Blastopirellula sp.]